MSLQNTLGAVARIGVEGSTVSGLFSQFQKNTEVASFPHTDRPVVVN